MILGISSEYFLALSSINKLLLFKGDAECFLLGKNNNFKH
jgi:hypothetical protein